MSSDYCRPTRKRPRGKPSHFERRYRNRPHRSEHIQTPKCARSGTPRRTEQILFPAGHRSLHSLWIPAFAGMTALVQVLCHCERSEAIQ